MAEIRKACDVYQGYNFKKDKQSTVGFLTKIKIGDKELSVDQTCKDPTNPESDLKCVTVLSDISWATGVTDAVYVNGQISVTNRQDVSLLILKDMTKIDVEFQFCIYEYDPVEKKYFKCFHCNDTDMKGILEKQGTDLSLSVANDASTQVQSPENYSFFVGIKPQPEQQTLHVATSVTNKVAKYWGLTVSD